MRAQVCTRGQARTDGRTGGRTSTPTHNQTGPHARAHALRHGRGTCLVDQREESGCGDNVRIDQFAHKSELHAGAASSHAVQCSHPPRPLTTAGANACAAIQFAAEQRALGRARPHAALPMLQAPARGISIRSAHLRSPARPSQASASHRRRCDSLRCARSHSRLTGLTGSGQHVGRSSMGYLALHLLLQCANRGGAVWTAYDELDFRRVVGR